MPTLKDTASPREPGGSQDLFGKRGWKRRSVEIGEKRPTHGGQQSKGSPSRFTVARPAWLVPGLSTAIQRT